MPSRASLADTSEVQDIFCRRAHGLARANSQKVGVGLIQTSPARRSGIQTKGGLELGLHGRLDIEVIQPSMSPLAPSCTKTRW